MKGLIRLLGLGSSLLIMTLGGGVQAAPSMQSPDCDYYVDNTASGGGEGSLTLPWNDINDHVGDLFPGDTMCVRGDVSGSGRVYEVDRIFLNSQGGTVRDGEPGNPITVRSYPGEQVILQNVSDDSEHSIVYFRGADYWILEGFVMNNNGRGKQAVRFKYSANHNILRDNEIYNGEVDGIVIGTTSDYEQNVGNVIEHNQIHHFDAGDADAHGILLNPGSDDTVIRENEIHDCSGDGVQIYAMDSTPISEYSQDVQIVDNVFYRGTLGRSEDGIDVKGVDGLEVTGNELSGYGYYRSAIVAHKGSRSLLFDSNVVYDSPGIDAHNSDDKYLEDITIRNNLFYNINHYTFSFADVYGMTIYHNTIANVSGYSFNVWGEGIDGGDIRNNLVYNSGEANVSTGTPFDNVTVGYNGWFDTDADSEFTDSTDIGGSGDPGFVDAANDDYHLTAASPACDAGTDVGVTADFEGDLRPYGDHPDIGADEYVSDVPPVPTLSLVATPHDSAIYLSWTEFEDPALDSYVITYTYGTGGNDASQGPSPITNIPTTTHTYSLTGVANYISYIVTIAARDESHTDLAASNGVRTVPTDIFVYLPLVMKRAP